MTEKNNHPIVFDELGQSVLSSHQQKCLPLLEEFSNTHFLGGGTTIALQLGHRKSIDFDLFSLTPQGTPRSFLKRIQIFKEIIDNDNLYQEIVAMDLGGYTEEQDEFMIHCLSVRCHFININRTLYKDQKIVFHPNKYIQGGIRTLCQVSLF